MNKTDGLPAIGQMMHFGRNSGQAASVREWGWAVAALQAALESASAAEHGNWRTADMLMRRFCQMLAAGRTAKREVSKPASVRAIEEAYRVILGREIDSEQLANHLAVHYLVQHSGSTDALLVDLLRSTEFYLNRGPLLEPYMILPKADMQLFATFGRFEGPGTPGFVTDFLGTKTDVRFVNAVKVKSGIVESFPFPVGNFHGDTTEWLSLLMSIGEARGSVTVMELGAGWAPWLVAAARAASKVGIRKVRLVGVEASSAHFEFMQQHFVNNELSPEGHLLLHGAVGAKDGHVRFPIADDPAADWGQAPLFNVGVDDGSPALVDYRGMPVDRTEEVRVYSLDSLLANEELVDLLHVDVQGTEVELLSAGLDTMGRKVKALVVGTHGRQIEEDLAEVLIGAGWVLCREQACAFGLGGSSVTFSSDGTQFWRNARYFPARDPV